MMQNKINKSLVTLLEIEFKLIAIALLPFVYCDEQSVLSVDKTEEFFGVVMERQTNISVLLHKQVAHLPIAVDYNSVLDFMCFMILK